MSAPSTMKRTRTDGLLSARAAVETTLRGFFGVLPDRNIDFRFGRSSFFFGVLNSYLTLFLFARAPQSCFMWHTAQILLYTPVHAYRWHRRRCLAYFVEFCWVTNISMALYMATLIFAPDVVPIDVRVKAFRFFFAIATGPLGFSVLMLNNALVPHSMDHNMSLQIHLSPGLAAFGLRWYADADRTRFPLTATPPMGALKGVKKGLAAANADPLAVDVTFFEYMAPALCLVGLWAVGHFLFMLRFHHSLARQGHKDTYGETVRGNPMMAAVIGKEHSGGSETVRLIKYEVLTVLGNCILLSLSYPLFKFGSADVHAFIIFLLCCGALYNGAGWYAAKLIKFRKTIDELIAHKDD